jgi:uncharacterized BrkB/YihY/UPF0761 family membrane protein
MLWLYLTAIVIMIGGVINAVLREMRDEKDESLQEQTIKEILGDSKEAID